MGSAARTPPFNNIRIAVAVANQLRVMMGPPLGGLHDLRGGLEGHRFRRSAGKWIASLKTQFARHRYRPRDHPRSDRKSPGEFHAALVDATLAADTRIGR